ncbi:MAG: ribonuclease III, partial [Oscillospiraceae bacterium]
QAEASAKILPLLTEEEHDVFRRGRNASPHSVPKAASRDEYATATAVEALFGYLYLQGKTDRLNELFTAMMEPDETEVT